jgi:hypothetical protein
MPNYQERNKRESRRKKILITINMNIMKTSFLKKTLVGFIKKKISRNKENEEEFFNVIKKM